MTDSYLGSPMNINLQKSFILCVVFLFCNILVAGTNELWFSRVDASFMRESKDFTIQQVCILLEKESQKLDQRGRGVRIIYALLPLGDEVAIFHNNGAGFRGMSLIDILTTIIRFAQLDCIVTEDVAIIGRWNYRCVSVALSGKCYDIKTGNGINTFRIESSPWPGVLSISTNGCYICALPCLVNILVNDDVMMPSREMFNTKKEFRVVAPGYNEKIFLIDVFLPGKAGYQEVNLPLEPSSASVETGGNRAVSEHSTNAR